MKRGPPQSTTRSPKGLFYSLVTACSVAFGIIYSFANLFEVNLYWSVVIGVFSGAILLAVLRNGVRNVLLPLCSLAIMLLMVGTANSHQKRQKELNAAAEKVKRAHLIRQAKQVRKVIAKELKQEVD